MNRQMACIYNDLNCFLTCHHLSLLDQKKNQLYTLRGAFSGKLDLVILWDQKSKFPELFKIFLTLETRKKYLWNYTPHFFISTNNNITN